MSCSENLFQKDNNIQTQKQYIDLFVQSIKLEDFHFTIKVTKEGRPAYHPKDLLKIFVYGYLNHIRSSRQLEKECKGNIELMWLMNQLTPDHNTISNFRRDNEKAIKKVFRYTVSIAKQFDLIGGKLVAGGSTKLRAQNSKKNNFNEAKIKRHIAYIDAKLEEYNNALAIADNDYKQVIADQIKKHQDRKDDYQDMQQQLTESGEPQISTSDPESRQSMTRNNISEVAYSVKTVVDAKHNLPIDYKVTNQNDNKALSGMLRRAKTILGTNDFTALYDKGYHTGCEIKAAVTAGIDIMVAMPGVSSFAPDEKYNMDQFSYNEQNDTYTCPQGKILTTNGTEYQKTPTTNSYAVKHYKTTECHTCPARSLCTKRLRGRLIERSEFTPYIEQNKQNIASRPELYKQRQSIVEHPYGTIKRQWGFYYIITKKGMKRASADVGLMFIAYNMRRLMNIIDASTFKKFLKELTSFLNEVFGSFKAIIFKIRLPFCYQISPRVILQTA